MRPVLLDGERRFGGLLRRGRTSATRLSLTYDDHHSAYALRREIVLGILSDRVGVVTGAGYTGMEMRPRGDARSGAGHDDNRTHR